MSPPLPSLLALQTRRKESILPVEDAWTIALQWSDRLRNRVLLERDPDESSGVAKSCKWIRFDINSNEHNQVSAARAAAVAWFALSCCPGYGGDENPVFWKCLFSEYAHFHVGHLVQDEQSITDAHGFFDGEGVDFPRFKLSSRGTEVNLLLFCGHPNQELEGADELALRGAMEILAPCVDRERTARQPVVSLDIVREDVPVGRRESLAALASHAPIDGGLLHAISDASRWTRDPWPSPIFVVRELNVQDTVCVGDQKLLWLHEMQRSIGIDIPVWDCCDSGELSGDALADIVRSVLSLKARELRFSKHDEVKLGAFASALPMSTSIQSVRVDRFGAGDEWIVILWLAYALFHPDTPASPWTSLVLKFVGIDRDCTRMLRVMAKGNNLAAMLHGREATSDGYYRGILKAKAGVYDLLAREAPQQPLKTTPIVTSDGTLEVEVCDVASEDPQQWGEWVQVVLPAYGLGWCRSADFARVVKRPAAKATLTHLVLRSRDGPSNVLADVVSVIGQRLVHLDYLGVASPADLFRVLQCCLLLESLAVQHDGGLWTDEATENVLPHLRELHLRLRVTSGHFVPLAMMRLPRSLHVLRVSAPDASGVYQRSSEAIRHILSQPSNLRVFHWADGLYASRHPIPYKETCADTSRRLDTLTVAPWRPYDATPLPRACSVAFLSVISLRKESAVALLGPELREIIVGFAGTRAVRSIVLEPETDETGLLGQRIVLEHNPFDADY